MTEARTSALIIALAMAMTAPLDVCAGEGQGPDDAVFTQRLTNPYGAPIPLEVARRVTAAAIAEAKKNSWIITVAVVDPGGVLVYFERMDGAQTASSDLAIEKARAAAAFKRSTKLLEDRIVAGRMQYLRLSGALPIEGGLPLIVDGRIVGAVAVSGARSEQDGVCARAAVKALPNAAEQTR